ncbi:MAG: ribosomal protein S3AE [Thermoplasmatales archaeon SG8-52-3]|nr:MAG: ribosomal protein S3AE [Thermoplasmatales archaeon SG8-52-3]
MAKARSRAAARKVKDRWKAKNWYNIIAPPAFDSVTIADTMTDNPDNLINRVTGVSLQDLTNDFRKSHITLFFKINKVEEDKAHTQFTGHTLTSDYLRRMIRRRRSKIEGVFNVDTRDGALIKVKPFATTDKRIQNSQRKVVREAMKKTIADQAKDSTLSEFMKNILDGRMGSEIYKNCKKLYPVKRIEIHKTEVVTQPTIKIEEKKPKKEVKEETKEKDIKEKKPKVEKKEKEVKEPKPKVKDSLEEEKKTEKPKDKKKEKKTPKTKKATTKKTVKKKIPAKKTTKPKTATKKKTTKKK